MMAVLAGCGTDGVVGKVASVANEAEFSAAYEQLYCDVHNACLEADSLPASTCEDTLAVAPDGVCELFDLEFANTCLEQLAEAECNGDNLPALPNACQRARGRCGLAESVFIEEFGNLICHSSNDCLRAEGLDTIDCDATVEDAGDVEPVVCDYDPERAQDCLDGLYAAGCDGAILEVPSSCGSVYTNCR